VLLHHCLLVLNFPVQLVQLLLNFPLVQGVKFPAGQGVKFQLKFLAVG
jgi:hypothetical protein